MDCVKNNENFERKSNESFEDYQMRICGLKEIKGLTWQEVADIINTECDVNFSESKYRKNYNTFMQGYNKRDRELVDNDKLLNKYEEKLDQIKSEKDKLYALRIEKAREDRQNNRRELFYENLAKTSEQLPLPKGFKYIEPKEYDKEYLLTIADIHAGAKFETIHNIYDFQVITQRFQILYDRTVKFITERNINKLNITFLGDEIQGILRIMDLKLNESSVINAIIFIRRTIARFLNDLSTKCRINAYFITKSNHNQNRPLGTKASELVGEDISEDIITYVKDVLDNNSNIDIHYSNQDFIDFNIFDFQCIALHGHTINNIYNANKDLSNNHRTLYDYLIMAHSHSSKEIINGEGVFHNVETLVAPSFIGSCPYADKLLVGSQPACKIYVFDEVYGHTESHLIILR